MIKLPKEFADRFEAMMADERALRDKYRMFAETVHEEHKALSVRIKATWDDVKEALGLEGDFRYEDGKLLPVNRGPDGAPTKIVDGGAPVNADVQ